MLNGRPQGRVFFHIFTICPRRNKDAATIVEYFKRNGWEITRDVKKADLVLFNTCAAEKEIEDKSIRKIGLLKLKKGKNSRLVICGCLPGINRHRLHSVFKGATFGPRTLEKLDEIVGAKVKIGQIREPKVFDLEQVNREGLLEKFIVNFRLSPHFLLDCVRFFSRSIHKKNEKNEKNGPKKSFIFLNKKRGYEDVSAFDEDVFKIRVARGCSSKCSYCAIRFTTGRLQSRPLNDIIDEFKDGLKNGHKKFILIGEDLGAYGKDMGLNICVLLKEIFRHQGDYKFGLDDFNIRWLLEHFHILKGLFKANRERIGHILLPIQSGSDKVLSQMCHGEYPSEEIKRRVVELKREIPSLKIYTHIMIGFPGETWKDFRESLNLIKELKFDRVDFYKYSERPNTLACRLPNKIPEVIKQMRVLYAHLFYLWI